MSECNDKPPIFCVTKKQIIQSLNAATLLFENNIKADGFEKATSTYRDLQVYYNKKLGIVVKRPAWILDPHTPSFLCVPTVKLQRGWVVQPIVKKTRLKEAVRLLEKQLKPYRKQGYCPDLHAQNVGWYKNKPLMYDW